MNEWVNEWMNEQLNELKWVNRNKSIEMNELQWMTRNEWVEMNEGKWMVWNDKLKPMNWYEWIEMSEVKWMNWNEWIDMNEMKWMNWSEWIEMTTCQSVPKTTFFYVFSKSSSNIFSMPQGSIKEIYRKCIEIHYIYWILKMIEVTKSDCKLIHPRFLAKNIRMLASCPSQFLECFDFDTLALFPRSAYPARTKKGFAVRAVPLPVSRSPQDVCHLPPYSTWFCNIINIQWLRQQPVKNIIRGSSLRRP